MSNSKTVSHGGAVAVAALQFGGAKTYWLDLSTGINPVSAPLPELSKAVWQALPDADLLAECLQSARSFYGIPTHAALVAAPGVQALIQLLPQLRPGKSAAILSPTYGEYEHVFNQLGTGARTIKSADDLREEAVIIAVNPNNPDGRTYSQTALSSIAETISRRNGLLIIDEAFGDLKPETTMMAQTGTPGILVLKSFGKFFGLAGVRLGFAVGHADDIAKLEQHLGPWAVSGPALAIGAACLSDPTLKSKTAETIYMNSNRQRTVLEQLGLDIIADTGLFHLIEHPKAHALHQSLARQHILTRKFEYDPSWLRLGLCKNTIEVERLKQAVTRSLAEL